jgi:hypothetical protein
MFFTCAVFLSFSVAISPPAAIITTPVAALPTGAHGAEEPPRRPPTAGHPPPQGGRWCARRFLRSGRNDGGDDILNSVILKF